MNNTMESTVERTPKYNVGDKVVYYCLYGKEEKTGIVESVEEMDEYEWNKDKKDRFLYTLNNYDYIRSENEIMGLCDE